MEAGDSSGSSVAVIHALRLVLTELAYYRGDLANDSASSAGIGCCDGTVPAAGDLL